MEKYRWCKIDTASIMFSSLSSEKWGRTFRLSAYFKDEVDPVCIEQAVRELMPCYPTIYAYLKKGFFWNYLALSDKLPEIRELTDEGMLPVVKRKDGRPDFRITYKGNRISIECSHSLGDGKGIQIYFNALLERYNELKKGEKGEYISSEKPSENSRNAFADYYDKNGEKDKRKNGKAFHFSEIYEDNYLDIRFLEMNTSAIKELSHKEDLTITEYMTAVLILGIIKSVNEPINEDITVAVPVNLRRFFPTPTVRNFTVQSFVTFSPKGRRDVTLREIIEKTRGQLRHQLSKEELIKSVNKFGGLVNNPVLRVVPNVIKLPVLRKMQKSTHEGVSTIFTNYGDCRLPESLLGDIEKLQFVNGDTRSYGLSVTCSCIGYGEKLSMCFSHANKDTTWYETVCKILENEGLAIEKSSITGKAHDKKYPTEGFREKLSAEKIKAYFNI